MLATLGIQVDESFLIQAILNSLPAQFGPFKIHCNATKEKWSLNELTNLCVHEEVRLRKERRHTALAVTQVAMKEKGKVRKYSPMKVSEPEKSSQGHNRFTVSKGHVKEDCNKRKAWFEKKGNNLSFSSVVAYCIHICNVYIRVISSSGKMKRRREEEEMEIVWQTPANPPERHDYIFRNAFRHEPPVMAWDVSILQKEPDVLTVCKPASVPVHASGQYRKNTVVGILEAEHGLAPLFPIHRLDRLVSGLLILARSASKADFFRQQIEARVVHKQYVAKVVGAFPEDEQVVNANVNFNVREGRSTVEVESAGNACTSLKGKAASTKFTRISTNGTHSIIRVHLQYTGHPIANDTLYLSEEVVDPFSKGMGADSTVGVSEEDSKEGFSIDPMCTNCPNLAHKGRISVDAPTGLSVPAETRSEPVRVNRSSLRPAVQPSCATVEEMGEEAYSKEASWKESLRVRWIIRDHFDFHGAPRVRGLPPEQFCKQGFVLGKASEAGFGNEMYKILTAAGLSIMLNRGKFPFESHLSYTNLAFTMKEVKHLWRLNDCMGKYGRRLNVRTDDFEKPTGTNALCSNWRTWKQPIIWFQGTTDAVAAQFFLKNIHTQMSSAGSALFGKTQLLHSRPNTFGELMRVIISPSKSVEEAVNWVLNGGPDPHLALHMRMLMNRSPRAVKAALNCIKKVLHFDYNLYKGSISGKKTARMQQLGFRVKDWGPAPRWVAFVDFFLASRAKHAVVSGAHRRVGTTYAQLIAALAAAHQLDENHATNFSFISSFQSNLLSEGLQKQIGWGHVWNRFAGPLSCRNQQNQCALTPLLPPGWWDGILQSPIPRDARRLETYGVKLDGFGSVDESHLRSFCTSRKYTTKTIPVTRKCTGLTCA
ncbi:hypothetical protein RHGRI_024634 [Rhododendron griersonianum]|uniref:Pseudouridine synthase RsuA/RluA-like domain-containing protein n=1 Tax=Rhododendron griersonianum TaxID=479676 RepID=A0AAV6J941_9ERIC|nr:hypothetical protein RHGRI_024634 [Rhododendron griersonianum]